MTYTEYGIQAPNGDVHWGSFIGRSLESEQDRAVLSLVLHKTAQELNWPEDEFVDRFRWVSRTISEVRGQFEIDHPKVAPPLQQQGAPVPEEAPASEPVKATKPRVRKTT